MKQKLSRLARKNLQSVTPYKPGKPIDEVKRELGLKSVVKMASNENPLGPSRKVVSAAVRAMKTVNRYPDGGCFYLKRAIASRHKVRPENVIAGNGSDELIVLAIRAFVEKGEDVLIARPTFLVYEIASKVEDVNVATVPLSGLKYDLEAMASRITKKTKLVFIANPDNPTGSYVTRREVAAFLRKVGPDTIVFFDEAYYDFAARRVDFPDLMSSFRGKNVIVSRTFSKAYGLAGLRIGYAIADEPLISAMDRVREPFNVNSVAQAAAAAALKDTSYVKKNVKLVECGKKFLCDEIQRLGYRYVRTATNFILVNLKEDTGRVYTALLKEGVIVREMSAWGMRGFIRVTVGTPAENRKFLKALKRVRT